jgi:hypothetical protein
VDSSADGGVEARPTAAAATKCHRERCALSFGGVFDFDSVSADGTIALTISTSGATTASGKHAVGKLMKIQVAANTDGPDG